MAAERNSSSCDTQYNTMYRAIYLQEHYAKKEWFFMCWKCLLKHKKTILFTNTEEPGKVGFNPFP